MTIAQMINTGKELIRISPKDSHRIEYSTSSGKSWFMRYSTTSHGEFLDLTHNGKEILATINGKSGTKIDNLLFGFI